MKAHAGNMFTRTNAPARLAKPTLLPITKDKGAQATPN